CSPCGASGPLLRSPASPAVLPSMSLVAVIEVPFHANYADHTFHMGLVDLDEKPFGLQIEGQFRAAPGIEHTYGRPGLSPVAVPIHGLTLERPGEYSFTLAVDGNEIERYPFSVGQVASVAMTRDGPAPPPPAGPADEGTGQPAGWSGG